ncbi:MAG: hypothetical protein AAF787_16155 [Chloroflexota bacterium]
MRRLQVIFILFVLCFMVPVPAAAQDPTPAPLNLATNTPRPATPAAVDQYALRLWSSADLVRLLDDQLRQLEINEGDAATFTAQLALYELEERFPATFDDADTQERLLPLLLNAPPGAVDARPIVRPYVARLMTRNRDVFLPSLTATYNVGAFEVIAQPVAATPLSDNDVILRINDTNSGYQDVVFGRFTETDVTVLPASPDYPAAPFNDATAVELLRVDDINGNGSEEFAVAITREGRLNREVYVYGVRGDEAFELTIPPEQMLATGAPQWEDGQFIVTERRLQADSFWRCAEQRRVLWAWGNNTFFPQPQSVFTAGDALACQLDAQGNVFTLAPAESITRLEPLIAGEEPDDTVTRVNMVLAMLHLLNGQPNEAVQYATVVIENTPDGSARAAQAQELLAAVGQQDISPLTVCSALTLSEPYAVCDVEAVTARVLADPFNTTEPIDAQLDARRIPHGQVITLQQVGRRSRPAAFLLLGEGLWIAFNEADGSYTAEVIDPPEGVETEIIAPASTIDRDNMLFLLFESDDRTAVITALDSLEANPALATLPPDLQFLRAMANDFAGNRQIARQQYYDLWQSDVGGVWGQFAARHLERR